MKLLLLLLLFSSLEQIFSHDVQPETVEWANDRTKWFEPGSLRMSFKTLRVPRPSPRHFFGLMGKKSLAKSQITRKRQKFQAFVGLMGKRNVEDFF